MLFKGITNFECEGVVFCYCISLQRKAFSILHTLTLFIFYPQFSVFFLPSNIVHFNTYIRFQFHFIRSPILMDSLDGGYMKLDWLRFHSQPQLNRMVLFFPPILLGIFVFGKTKKISNEKSIDVECCLVVFCL